MPTALVTGAAGFVGRHFTHALDEAGYDVTAFDINPRGLPGVRLLDARAFFSANSEHYDLVVHLAAVVGGRAKIEGEPLSLAVDLEIDASLFQWALRTKPKRVIYYSSSAAYPVAYQQPHGADGTLDRPYPLREDDLNLNPYTADHDAFRLGSQRHVIPDMTYGWAKLTGEMLAQHAEAEGVRVHVFRPFSGYGEDQSSDYPFPSFADRARRRDDPFTVWGDGTQVRDWIHISDVVAATLSAVDHDVPGPANLCTGRPTPFNDLAQMFAAAAGYTPELKHILDAPKGVAYRVGDPTKMLAFYTPKITLEEGIDRALKAGPWPS
ncbi:NAD(P)-dependent oxidoreductase [Streptosporangium sp. NPDC051022]|uniref:NAD-dependent epimerase/dehydratase family protein n=1 Tax=Streptosporangium sp. NPDC051022 TaxID=3155752 RepID=UPI00343E3D7E